MNNVRAIGTLTFTLVAALAIHGCSGGSSGGGGGGPLPPGPGTGTGTGTGGGGTSPGTTFSPSSNTQMIYVSNSDGDDANPGTSTQPVKSIAAGIALLRDGQPDWLLLKKGDVWDEGLGQWRLSGSSPSAPMIVWSYGTGARPRLRTGATSGLFTAGSSGGPTATSNLVFSGLHFQAHTRIPGSPTFTGTNGSSGISWLRGTTSLLIDDCVIESYANGINMIDFDDLGITGVTIRRCLILDSYNVSPTHSQGMYVERVNGITIEECIFDHNGWNETLSGGTQATIFNHNIYIQTSSRNVIVRKNIILRASSHGLQLRPGGQCTDNIFIRNPINILVGGGDTPVPGGVDGICTGNVVSEGTEINGSPRGWGIDLENIRTATVSNNIVVNLLSTNTVNAFGIDDDANATFSNNTVFNWPGSPTFETPGPFADDTVNAAAYNGLQGGPATFQGFVDSLRAQSRDNYNTAFTADAIRTYFQQGFTP